MKVHQISSKDWPTRIYAYWSEFASQEVSDGTYFLHGFQGTFNVESGFSRRNISNYCVFGEKY